MLFLLPGMLFSLLSPLNFYSNFSIRVVFLEPPSTPITLVQHQGLSCHRSQIILPMELFVQHMPPPNLLRAEICLVLCSWPSASRHLLCSMLK